MSTADSPTDPPEPEPTLEPSPRRMILSVDDSLTIRKLIENALRPEGYEVILAATGEEGLAVARERRPDLVLLDYVLPDLRGGEFCQRLGADERTREIPVLLISGHGSAIQDLSHDSHNVVDYLTKPFASNVLQAVVSNAFEKHAARLAAGLLHPVAAAPHQAPTGPVAVAAEDPPPAKAATVALDELRRRVFERIVARLHAQLPSIPAWEAARGPSEPLSYYLSRLLPLDLVEELAQELARAAELPEHSTTPAADADSGTTLRGSTRFVTERHVLNYLCADATTGELRFVLPEETVTLWLDAGAVTAISSNHPRLYCAGSVYPFLQVPHAVVSAAMLAQRDASVPFFVTAAERGVYPEGVNVGKLLRESGHRCMKRVYAAGESRFGFRALTLGELPGFARPGSPHRVDFFVPQLLLESYRTVTDWQHVQQVIPRLELYVGRTAYDTAYLEALQLDDLETELLNRMDFRHTVTELQEATGRPLFEVCRAIYGLARLDLCYLSDLPMDEEETPGEIVTEAVNDPAPEESADPSAEAQAA